MLTPLLITLVLYRPIGNLIIDKTDWDEKLQQTIQEKLQSENSEKEDKSIADDIVEGAKKGILPETSKNISTNIIYGGTMIGLFIVTRLLLILINLMADAITSLPIIKQFNEAGGITYGLLRGIIIVYAIIMIINLIISLDPHGAVYDIVQSSMLTKLLINNNLINLFFNK